MSVVLATAWRPRGELERFQALMPELLKTCPGIAISLPPEADPGLVSRLNAIPAVQAVAAPDWSWGRYLALKKALESTSASHILYADFDRLLRWVETRPDEWRRTVLALDRFECLIVGRTEAAYLTHPLALVQTEAISNRVVSYLLGKPVDVSAGCKGFSRQAAEYLISNTSPGRALGTDAEWTVLLHRASVRVDYIEVDGLDWESADRYKERAATQTDQRQAAKTYDADPESWASRVAVAMEIVDVGLEVMLREVKPAKECKPHEVSK